MTRERLSLDGDWQFLLDEKNLGPIPDQGSSWREVHVPGSWQAQFDDLRVSHGTGWYRCMFEIPSSWDAQSLFLHFEAVNYYSCVWVNEKFAGDHEGGYLPFEFDITSFVKPGERNELVVRAHLPPWDDLGTPFGEIPHGKQSWYGPLGGIWQSVWVESRPGMYLTKLRITPGEEMVNVQVAVSSSKPEGETILFEIIDPMGDTINSMQTTNCEANLLVSHPLLWSPETPFLYLVRATLYSNSDTLMSTFGFRKVETREGKIFLNEKPIYLRGALDQDYYPDSINTPPSIDFLEDQIRKAKAMGLNCLRVHIKIPDPRYLDAADRLGILIWEELPSWAHLTPAAIQRSRQTIAGMINRDWNHPSVIIWTIINEAWGTELDNNPDHRAWLAKMFDWVKQLDPTRLVVDNSPCFPNAHVKSDLDDFHYYAAMPDGVELWDAWVKDLANRPTWLYAPNFQENIKNGSPLLASEFGNWGLPEIDPLMAHYGGEPWWFETGWDWQPNDVYPHGAATRFRDLCLDQVFGNYQGLARSSQWAQYEAIKYEIETLRLHPKISGYVITEFTDVHWECNGLLDLFRSPKVYFDRVKDLQADLLVILRLKRSTFWVGETCRVTVSVSNVSASSFVGSLTWAVTGPGVDDIYGELQDMTFSPFETISSGLIEFTIPTVLAPVRGTLICTLRDPAGIIISQNDLHLTIFPRQNLPRPEVICPDPILAEKMQDAGYLLAPSQSTISNVPLLLSALDAPALTAIQQGYHALLLAETPGAIQTHVPRLHLQARMGTSWVGNWASAFAWFRRDRFGRQIPGDGRLDFTFVHIYPETVITNVRPKSFKNEVLAGIFVGWLRSPAALIQRIPIGQGVLLVCTLKLKSHIGKDPLATLLLDELLRSF